MPRPFHLSRLVVIAILALSVASIAPAAHAQRGGGFHGGGGFRGGGFGGFRGGGFGGFRGDDRFRGGCCFFGFGGFGFGGYPYWPYASYYPPAYPYYYPPYPAYPPSAYPSGAYPPSGYPLAAAPAAPGAPGAAPASFEVYFPSGSDRLDAAAHRVIAQAAARAAQAHEQIAVAGFTDAAGNAASNLDLSRRRAESVKAALIGAGVPQPLIALAWHGQDGQQVPDRTGVGAAQNRRVLIMVGAPPPPDRAPSAPAYQVPASPPPSSAAPSVSAL